MTNNELLGLTLNKLVQSDYSDTESTNFIAFINDVTTELLQTQKAWSPEQIDQADKIIRISNIMYNNTSKGVLPLDDGVYDQLLVVLQKYKPNYQIGSTPTEVRDLYESEEAPQTHQLYFTVSDKELDNTLYSRDIMAQHVPWNNMRPLQLYTLLRDPISKRLINTTHKYPELVGTLDKCKFVLNNDAKLANAYDTPSVQIFERDFIHPCLASGIIGQYEVFDMMGELKYDGVSIEAEVKGDRIISALSRGDTTENIATDLTPVFEGYRFYNATNKVPADETFGLKFEAVMTYRNLEHLSSIKGKEYKNGRNAIIGVLGSTDAYKYTELITLIPISSSKTFPSRIEELNWLNKYYNSGEYNRYQLFRGDYMQMLFQVKQFMLSAETIRPVLPYMIDGVVISFTDPSKQKVLGRVNSVNKWQMAIKFSPKEARTIFMGYSYSMGKSGTIIPMVHFRPVEFIGTIHTKQTIHSFQKFKELELCKGQEIKIIYMNDVLTYVERLNTPFNEAIRAKQAPEAFITHCPFCGTLLEISESYKSVRCPNVNCHERQIMRMIDMIDKLNFKDISEDLVRTLDITSLVKLMYPFDRETLVKLLGPLTTDKFLQYRIDLLNRPINDYSIMGAMGFDSLGNEKWKLILSVLPLHRLVQYLPSDLVNELNKVKGIGPGTVRALCEGFATYRDDVLYVLNNLHIVDSASAVKKPKVVLTGVRSDALVQAINNLGYDCDDNYSVTKDTALLITLSASSTSGKMQKAQKYGVPVVTLEEFARQNRLNLNSL